MLRVCVFPSREEDNMYMWSSMCMCVMIPLVHVEFHVYDDCYMLGFLITCIFGWPSIHVGV